VWPIPTIAAETDHRGTLRQHLREEDWIPRYNIAPTQPVPIIRQHPKERVKEFSLIRLRAVQDSLIVDDVQVFRAQREHLPLSRLAEELCKFDKSFSGS
jgi:putative SOS response-associated peptidase YedK